MNRFKTITLYTLLLITLCLISIPVMWLLTKTFSIQYQSLIPVGVKVGVYAWLVVVIMQAFRSFKQES